MVRHSVYAHYMSNELSAKQLEKMMNNERKVFGNSAQYQRLFRLWNEAMEREYNS